jgi:hypothetical protein
MIKQVLNQFDYSLFAEAALVAFAMIFVAVVMRTLLLRSETTNQYAKIVLGDKTENKNEQ